MHTLLIYNRDVSDTAFYGITLLPNVVTISIDASMYKKSSLSPKLVYEIVKGAMTWNDTLSACEGRGSTLASVTSINILNNIVSLNITGCVRLWTSGTLVGNEWKWSNGWIIESGLWNSYAPSGDGTCVNINLEDHSVPNVLNDESCSSVFPLCGVCELYV